MDILSLSVAKIKNAHKILAQWYTCLNDLVSADCQLNVYTSCYYSILVAIIVVTIVY